MTTEEKLQHFHEACIADANTRAKQIIDEYSSALEKTFEDHKHENTRRAQLQLKIEEEKIHREGNKQLALEQVKFRRVLGCKQDELTNEIFEQLQKKLEQFMTTSEYILLLEKQIAQAIQFAGKDEVHIYIDPADEKLLSHLSPQYREKIQSSEYSFMGGTRAVIPHKNILIDHSFEKKLQEAKKDFHFDLGGNNNE